MLQPVTNLLQSLAESPAAAPSSQASAHGAPSVRAALRDAILVPVTAPDRAAGGARASATAKAPKTPKKKAASSSTSAGYAKSAATAKPSSSSAKASATSKPSGPLAFLDDPKLSLEDKLVRLLSYLNAKWDKELEAKMKELKGGAATTATKPASSAAKSSSKGLLGSVVGVAKQFFPQVGVALGVLQDPIARGILSKVGGPVLAAAATAVGFPQLAPLALSYGPALVDAAAGIATSVGDGPPEVAAAAASPSPRTSTASAGAKPGDAALSSDRDAQLKLMEIQRVMDQQKEMFSLVSNLLRTGHDTRMAVIQNVR